MRRRFRRALQGSACSKPRALTEPPGLDLLLGHALGRMRLAHILIAGRILRDQHIAEPYRAARSRAVPAGDVAVLVAPQGRELAVLVSEVRDLLTHVGTGIGAFPDGRDL